MFKKVLIDAHAIIDLPRNRFDRNMESIAKVLLRLRETYCLFLVHMRYHCGAYQLHWEAIQ
jgi:hypothetical protein